MENDITRGNGRIEIMGTWGTVDAPGRDKQGLVYAGIYEWPEHICPIVLELRTETGARIVATMDQVDALRIAHELTAKALPAVARFYRVVMDGDLDDAEDEFKREPEQSFLPF